MVTTVRWHTEEKTAVIIEISLSSHWDEFHESVRRSHALAREVPHPVSLIIHPEGKLPDGNPLTHFRMAFNNQPANVRRVVIIIPTDGSRAMVSFAKRLSSIIQKVYRIKSETVFVTSLEEAMTQVEQRIHE